MSLASVATSNLLLRTTGCAYTCPETADENSCPNEPAGTTVDVSWPWSEYQPCDVAPPCALRTSAPAATGSTAAIKSNAKNPAVRLMSAASYDEHAPNLWFGRPKRAHVHGVGKRSGSRSACRIPGEKWT